MYSIIIYGNNILNASKTKNIQQMFQTRYMFQSRYNFSPGMMEDPGSFSGSISSPSPQRGPEASSLMSLAIFIREQAMVLRAPETSTIASWLASASNLLGAVSNGIPKE